MSTDVYLSIVQRGTHAKILDIWLGQSSVWAGIRDSFHPAKRVGDTPHVSSFLGGPTFDRWDTEDEDDWARARIVWVLSDEKAVDRVEELRGYSREGQFYAGAPSPEEIAELARQYPPGPYAWQICADH